MRRAMGAVMVTVIAMTASGCSFALSRPTAPTHRAKHRRMDHGPCGVVQQPLA
jgi:hypothetical protein